ncbi:MAG: hypothetical protein U1E25_15605 [Methylocystis sp.]
MSLRRQSPPARRGATGCCPIDFLRHDSDAAAPGDLIAAFRLTGYFLTRDVLNPRGAALPAARDLYIGALLRAA